MACIDQFLINNINGSAYTFSNIAGYSTVDWSTHDAYFFLRKELADATDYDTFRAAQREKKIRHCKVYKGRWLDYTIGKEFNTLTEWAADANDTIDNVLYGVNRVHKKNLSASYRSKQFVSETPKYVTLQHLLEKLKYFPPLPVEIPEYKALDRFSDILADLDVLNGPIPPHGRNCLVQKPDSRIVVGRVIDEKYYSLGDTKSTICISVQQDTQHEFKSYCCLSDMPAGTKVYFPTSDGHFHSTSALVS